MGTACRAPTVLRDRAMGGRSLRRKGGALGRRTPYWDGRTESLSKTRGPGGVNPAPTKRSVARDFFCVGASVVRREGNVGVWEHLGGGGVDSEWVLLEEALWRDGGGILGL
jgi:hypothetical protein